MAEGRAAAVISRLGQITREMNDRRALRERNAAQHKEAARERLLMQGKVAERATQHLSELNRRQKAAGGWATGKALENKDNVMGFGPEDDDSRQKEPFPGYPMPSSSVPPPASTAPPTAPEQPAAQQPTQTRKFSRSVAPREPEPEAPKPPPPPPRPARRRREEVFDDEDFSNNSWMQ